MSNVLRKWKGSLRRTHSRELFHNINEGRGQSVRAAASNGYCCAAHQLEETEPRQTFGYNLTAETAPFKQPCISKHPPKKRLYLI